VVLALAVRGDGVPFYWEVLPGGTADVTTLTWLLEVKKLYTYHSLAQVGGGFGAGLRVERSFAKLTSMFLIALISHV